MRIFRGRRDSDGRKKAEAYRTEEAGRQSGEEKTEYEGAGAGERNIMAKHADPSIPDSPEEWLDEFNTFSIYQVLPKIIELWGLNVKVDVEAKKNYNQLTAK